MIELAEWFKLKKHICYLSLADLPPSEKTTQLNSNGSPNRRPETQGSWQRMAIEVLPIRSSLVLCWFFRFRDTAFPA
jgi:hypothetical protein